MKVHYELRPSVWHAQPLVFDWDQVAGIVTGPDANRISDLAADGHINYPGAMTVTFSDEPLKSKADMAAILAYEHHLPTDLVNYFPRSIDDGFPDQTHVDADGVTVVGRDQIFN